MKRLAILFVFCCSVVRGQLTDFQHTDFEDADSIAARYAAHPLTDLKTLADKLTGSLSTEQEKFRAIYQWVCGNIEADYELVVMNQQKRSTLKGVELARWNKNFNRVIFETLQRDRKTVCTGYAYLVRELAFHAGLSCTIVNGHAKHAGVNQNALGSVNHSWNEIRLNNKWYVCDATWSSGVFNLSKGIFVKKYDGRYFLMEPVLFFQSHAASGEASVVGRE
jgi:transglutaminase/protease-like cytokinesis protein 3